MLLPPSIARAIRSVRRRIRAQRALDTGVLLAIASLGLAAAGVVGLKVGWAPPLYYWVGTAILFPLGLLLGALRPVAKLLPAQLLDRTHDLQSRLSNALEFADHAERTPFMEAAIEDAASRASGLEPARAMPLRIPREWLVVVALGLGVWGLSLMEVLVRETVALPEHLEPLLLDNDSLEGFERSLDPVLRDMETAEDVRLAARALNAIVEDMADQRLDRTEALRRIRALEAQMAEGRPMNAEAVERSMEELGRELRRASLAEAASEALQEHDAAAAADAMRELARELENDPPSARELDRLREALEQAARDDEERRLREIDERREELESLLRRERENQAAEEQEERLLRRRRRELERLNRERQDVSEQRRQLERLRREMQQAAENLNRRAQDRNQASEAMRRAAEELNRMAREQMSEQQRQQLQRQMEQLREMIRRAQQGQNGQGGQGQQGQGQNGQGQGRQGRLQRFTLSANGQGARLVMPGQQGQGQQGQGQNGQGQQGQGQQGQGQGQNGQGQNGQGGQGGQGQGQQGQGQNGQGGQGQGGQGGQGQNGQGGQGQNGQGGQGQNGQGQGQNGQGGQGGQAGQGGQGGQGQNGQGQGGQVLTLSPGGQGQGNAVLEIPGMGGQGQGMSESMGEGGGQGGQGAGSSHDPIMLDDPTARAGGHQNTRVNGAPSDGPSRSEVILGAADRGFANQAYEQVFTDYEGHAEEVLERDEIPSGYRFYVRRYFQLIRPRDGNTASQGQPTGTDTP